MFDNDFSSRIMRIQHLMRLVDFVVLKNKRWLSVPCSSLNLTDNFLNRNIRKGESRCTQHFAVE